MPVEKEDAAGNACLSGSGDGLLAGCGKANGKLDPDNPVTIYGVGIIITARSRPL